MIARTPRRRSSAGAVAPVGRPRPRPSAGIPEADRHAIQSAIAEWDGRPTAPLSLSPTTDNEGSLSKPRPFGTPPVPAPAGLALPTAARPSPAPTALPRRRPHLGRHLRRARNFTGPLHTRPWRACFLRLSRTSTSPRVTATTPEVTGTNPGRHARPVVDNFRPAFLFARTHRNSPRRHRVSLADAQPPDPRVCMGVFREDSGRPELQQRASFLRDRKPPAPSQARLPRPVVTTSGGPSFLLTYCRQQRNGHRHARVGSAPLKGNAPPGHPSPLCHRAGLGPRTDQEARSANEPLGEI
jgi:hypothetical protein